MGKLKYDIKKQLNIHCILFKYFTRHRLYKQSSVYKGLWSYTWVKLLREFFYNSILNHMSKASGLSHNSCFNVG